jgi:peptidoglycan/LPS O-acetylase OafA/YrhL
LPSADNNVPPVGVPDSGHRRADIQGLRAIAVLLVVLFHTGLVVDSGFIGVDIFFVISGFVITSMLWRQGADSGSFSLKFFYVRRFRRLVPALALTVTVIMLLGALFFSPVGAQETTAQTAIGGMLLLSNLVIERVSGSYFGVPAETNALLNLWSLSVEEQFYLVFPILLICALWLGRSKGSRRTYATTLISLVTVASLYLCLRSAAGFSFSSQWQLAWLSGGTSSVGFYSPLTRSWEFGVGALAALVVPNLTRGSRGLGISSVVASVAGAGLMAYGLIVIGSDTPFPSLWTLLPVLGTALVIIAGSLSGNWLSRSLSARPLAAIGDWSYSIYLWNWPSVVLAASLWPHSDFAVLAATFIGLLVAVAAYKFWEAPLRASLKVGPISAKVVAVMVFAVPVCVGTFFVLQSSHLVQKSGFMKALAWVPYFDNTWNRCSDAYTGRQTPIEPADKDKGALCVSTGPMNAPVDVAIHGDSHAGALFPGLALALPEENVALGYTPENNENLPESAKAKVAVLALHWEKVQPADAPSLLARLTSEVEGLLRSSRHVVVVEDVPLFSYEASDCAFPAKVGPDRCSEEVPANRLDYAPIFREALKSYPNVDFLELRDLFCERSVCRFDPTGEVFYRDSNHLNPQGSEYVAQRIAPFVEKRLSGRDVATRQ